LNKFIYLKRLKFNQKLKFLNLKYHIFACQKLLLQLNINKFNIKIIKLISDKIILLTWQ